MKTQEVVGYELASAQDPVSRLTVRAVHYRHSQDLVEVKGFDPPGIRPPAGQFSVFSTFLADIIVRGIRDLEKERAAKAARPGYDDDYRFDDAADHYDKHPVGHGAG